MKIHNPYLIVFAFLLIGCEDFIGPETPDGLGLPRADLIIDSENLQILNNGVFSDRYVDAQFQYERYREWVNVRYQGRSTRNLSKKNYRIRVTEDRLFDQRRYTLLTSQFRDPSLMRSFLSYDLFRRTGLMVPKTCYCLLFLNKKYQGIYFMLEPIDKYFLWNRAKRVGNLYQAIGAIAHFTLTDRIDIRLKFEKKIGDEGNYSDLEYLLAVLDETPTSELPQRIERIFDVEAYLEYMAVSALIANWDGFYNNLHLYNDPDQERFVVIPWDMDLGMQVSTVDWEIRSANALNQKLLEVDAYRQRYKQKVQYHLDNGFSEQRVFAMIDSLMSVLHDAYEKDPFLKGFSLEFEAAQLKEFVRLRRVYLQGELARL